MSVFFQGNGPAQNSPLHSKREFALIPGPMFGHAEGFQGVAIEPRRSRKQPQRHKKDSIEAGHATTES